MLSKITTKRTLYSLNHLDRIKLICQLSCKVLLFIDSIGNYLYSVNSQTKVSWESSFLVTLGAD